MRWHIIVSGIVILSIIDFTLAAPVLVQEKRQACAEVVNIPNEVVTVLGKRGDDDLDKLVEEYFQKPVESPTSVPPGPNHGSTNMVQDSTTKPASSTTSPSPLRESSNPSSTAPSTLSKPLLDSEFEKPPENENSKTLEKMPVDSSDPHASSSSAPPGLDYPIKNRVLKGPPVMWDLGMSRRPGDYLKPWRQLVSSTSSAPPELHYQSASPPLIAPPVMWDLGMDRVTEEYFEASPKPAGSSGSAPSEH
jgi:hypothetical protein